MERGNPSDSEILKWLQEFGENVVDDEIPLQEALTPVLLMKHLESPHARDVRIWVNTVLILISL